MDVFEYLPQLIVAYDSNDEFANLIHVKKAKQDFNYYCPCCGGLVKPSITASTKEQSHYLHLSGECAKKDQLHFFCKNWLFEAGSKFYIDRELFEVKALDIEKKWDARFGEYIPDVTVYTMSGETIYFEMFFANRKTDDNYFCKWSVLGNSVVGINIKDYMCKIDKDTIPSFSYLYRDGKCFSKSYIKRDLYANTIGKIKKELTKKAPSDYKSRMERFDCFWQEIIGNASKDEIIKCIRSMPYDDMVSCYEIIKRKQCVSHLKKDVLNTINQQVINNIRGSLHLPFDENVYFDIEHINGKIYEIGIRLKIQTEHITYDQFYLHCCYDIADFKNTVRYPKIVFNKNLFTVEEIIISENKIAELENIFNKTVQYKNKLLEYEKQLTELEKDGYKIRLNNNLYTVLAKIQDNKFEPVFEKYYMSGFNIKLLLQEIQCKIKEKADKEFLKNYISGGKAQALIADLQNYKDIGAKVHVGYKKQWHGAKADGIFFDLSLYDGNIYSRILSANEDDFLEAIELSKKKIDEFIDKYGAIIDLVSKINSCKNGFWKAELLFDSHGELNIRIDQAYINFDPWNMTYEEINLSNLELSNYESICDILSIKMKSVMKNMERYGYRIMEVRP